MFSIDYRIGNFEIVILTCNIHFFVMKVRYLLVLCYIFICFLNISYMTLTFRKRKVSYSQNFT